MAAGNVGTLSVVLAAKTASLIKGMKLSEEGLRKVEQTMRGVGGTALKMSAALSALGAGAAFFAGRFEKQMIRAAAIAAGTASGFDDSFKRMSKAALDMAGRTEFTAQQVGEGMEKMAMAGNNAGTIISAMPAVLQLASAAAIDLGQSADVVTNIMAGLGQSTSQLGDANNVLVGTFTGANVTLLELGQSFKVVGPISKALKVSFEDTAAAIGLLGNAGIKGADAGTGLKRAFSAMANTTPKSSKALDTLGVSIGDLKEGGIGQLIAKLEGASKGFDSVGKEAEFTGLLFQAFGDRAGPKMAALVGQGAAAFDKLANKIEAAKATNLAEFLETKQVQSFTGQLNILRSAFEQMVVTIGQKLMPLFEPVVKYLQEIFQNIAGMSDETIESIVSLGKWAAVVTGVGGAALTASALIVGLAATFVGLGMAAEGAGVAMSLVVAGPLLAIGVGFGAFIIALNLVEEVTGKNVDVLGEMKDALSFASESGGRFKDTITNLYLALVSLNPVLGALLEMSGIQVSLSDARSDAENLSANAKEVLARHKEIADLKEKAKALGLDEKAGGTKLLRGVMETAGFEPGAQRRKDSSQSAALKSSEELTNKLQHAQRRLSDALVREGMVRDVNQRKLDEAAKTADDVAKLEEKRLKQIEDAEKEALKRAMRAEEMDKKRQRALESIARISEEAARSVALASTGEAGKQIMPNVFEFEDKMKALTEAAATAHRPLSDFSATVADLKTVLMNGVASALSAARGTDTFGTSLGLVADQFNRLGLSTEGLVATVDKLATKRKIGEGTGINFSLDLDKKNPIESPLTATLLELQKKLEDQEIAEGRRLQFMEAAAVQEINAINNSVAFNKALSDLPEILAALGYEVTDLTEKIKKEVAPKDLAPDVGSTLSDVLGNASFGLLKDSKIASGGGVTDEKLKGFTDVVGQQLGSVISGQGGSIGTVVGAGIGTAIGAAGGPIGSAVGGALGGLVEQFAGKAIGAVMAAIQGVADAINGIASFIGDALTSAASFIADAVPEERFGASLGSGAAAVAGIVVAAGAAIAGLFLLGVAAAAVAFDVIAFALAGMFLLGPVFLILAALAFDIFMALLPLEIALLVLNFALTVAIAGVLALVGAFVFLAKLFTSTKAFGDLSLGFEASIDRVVLALEPLGEKLLPLVGLFDIFMDVMITLIDSLLGSSSLMPVLFDIIKVLLTVIASLIYVGAALGNALLWTVSAILDGGAWLIEGWNTILLALAGGLADFLTMLLPLAAGAPELFASMLNAAASLRGLSANTEASAPMRDAADAARGMMVDLDALGASIVTLINSDVSAAAARAADLINQKKLNDEVSESLTNVPAGFKVALARFNAVSTGSDIGTRPGDNPYQSGSNDNAGTQWFIENMIIQGLTDDSLEKISSRAERDAANKTGNPFSTGSEFGRQGR